MCGEGPQNVVCIDKQSSRTKLRRPLFFTRSASSLYDKILSIRTRSFNFLKNEPNYFQAKYPISKKLVKMAENVRYGGSTWLLIRHLIVLLNIMGIEDKDRSIE